MSRKLRMHPEVYEAAKSGDFENLKKKISGNGEDLFHQTTPKQNNILHVAAQYKQVNLIKDLLRCESGRFLLWEGNNNEDTPLHLAAKVGSYEVVRVFTDLAKSVVHEGQVDMCRELLRKQNLHKDTALHYAVRGGHDGVAKFLIEEDPQLCDITNDADESPLYLAVDQGLSQTVELIFSAWSLSSSHKGPKGLTALHATLNWSPESCLKILGQRPEMIKEKDDIGWSLLHYCAAINKIETVKLLLRRDTSVAYCLDNEGESALHVAAFRGNINVIEELLKSCPDACDIVNTKGQTILHAAVINGQIKVVKHILEKPSLKDLLLNEQDTSGNTALHLAAHHKEYRIICQLAGDKKVDRSAKNKDHLTALDIFVAYKEDSYRAAKVEHVLKGSRGMPFQQAGVIEYFKKRLDKEHVEGHPAVPRTTNRKNVDSSIGSIIDLQLLVAVLIATVTFAATFTMPGGYTNDQGMSILAGRVAFKVFVISNTTAFSLSILAIFLLYDTSTLGHHQQARYTRTAETCIYIAIIGMGLAFACSTHVVLTTTIGIGIVPYVMLGCLVIAYCIGAYLDPRVNPLGLPGTSGRYVRSLLFDYGIL